MGIKRIYRGALRRLAQRLAPPELITALRFLRADSNPVFPKRNIIVADRVPKARVLILAPHPDDEAIGMGGVLAMHVANGSSVTVLYLTDGGGLEDDRTAQIAARREESLAVGRDLGIEQIFWDNADTRLTNDARTIDALAALLRKIEPELIYTPSLFDTHFDHFATNQVLGDALVRVPSLDASVVGYEVWDTIPFANYLVDVSPVITDKDRILAHYAIPHEYTDFTALCHSRGSVHFALHIDSERSRAKNGFAEAFLRFDSETYRQTLSAYVGALRADGSELVSKLQP